MRYIVDRIEGQFAVCEDESGHMCDIPLAKLPAEVQEGSVLDYINGGYSISDEAQEERRRKIRGLENDLFK